MEASPSNSCSVKDMVNGSHNFVIQGYSLAKGMGAHCERDLHRGKIPMGDLLLPLREELRGQLCLPLHHARLKGTNACALSELTLQYHSSRGKHKAHSHVGRFLESEPYTLSMCARCPYSPATLKPSQPHRGGVRSARRLDP